MRKVVLFGAAVLVLCGCQPKERAEPQETKAVTAPGTAGKPGGAGPSTAISTLKDVGDVEQEISISGKLAEQSVSAQIQEETLTNIREAVTMDTITVQPPFPKELWVEFKIRGAAGYGPQPVVLRGTVLRENEPIGEFKTIIGKYARAARLPEGVTPPQLVFQFNVLEGIETPPETMLVFAEADALLMPLDTPEESIDPATATADEAQRTQIRSNPVRINFAATTAPPAP
ncbi:MAG: hypothetical protein HYV26_13235 [Candidatus Hydrogenedentes bacterium]|nr:hypothetical protein [Candidatus Hydrogenedentota bacterium]MBI3118294.1 hypothetical protein [Candidatus Hydrogenedentota bacterium]